MSPDEDIPETTPAPEAAEAPQTVFVHLRPARRVRPLPLAAVLSMAALVLTQLLPIHVAQGDWSAVVLLVFGTLVAPRAFLVFLSQAPGDPVLELGQDRLRLPITTRAQEYLTFRYRDIQSLFVRGGAVPFGGLGLVADIAEAVWYLASDRARYVNGHQLVVDGGVTHSLLRALPRE